MGAGIPKEVPAHTLTMACISASQAICTGAEKIIGVHVCALVSNSSCVCAYKGARCTNLFA
jgi:hypothetical protein